MKTLVHLSDLHFGRVDHKVVEPLVEYIIDLAPDVVVVSGDLTQRARSDEFKQARDFLARLPGPQVVVPGNHDVPLHNPVDRLLRPLHKFRRLITDDLSPRHIDDELAVLGINTARSMVVKNGRVNEQQLTALRQALVSLPAELVKVVVTHHPFDVAPNVHASNRVGRAELALKIFAEQSVDVLLAGHLHISHSTGTGARYPMGGYQALVVSAGTATSTRGRGEANSFNVLRLDKRRVEIERMEWTRGAGRFIIGSSEVFARTAGGWWPVDAPMPNSVIR